MRVVPHADGAVWLQGFLSALVGLVSDPVAGFRKASVPGLCMGTVKGTLGLGLRPMAGLAESCSKASQGMALACLGRQGIQGRAARRVYAPGTMRRLQQDQQVSDHSLCVWVCMLHAHTQLSSTRSQTLAFTEAGRAIGGGSGSVCPGRIAA